MHIQLNKLTLLKIRTINAILPHILITNIILTHMYFLKSIYAVYFHIYQEYLQKIIKTKNQYKNQNPICKEDANFHS